MIVKQPTDYGCLAACCAMAAGTAYEAFVEFVGHDGSDLDEHGIPVAFDWLEAAMFLLKHGLGLGVCGIIDGKIENDVTHVEFTMPLRGNDAIIVVESEHLKYLAFGHAIYWDGRQVCDPSPAVQRPRALSSYTIRRIYFLHHFVKSSEEAVDEVNVLAEIAES